MKRGFSLIEILVVVGIVTILSTAVSGFGRSLFRDQRVLRGQLAAEDQARRTLRNLITEIRSARSAATGAYVLAAAASSTLTFYSDINGDNLTERIRYFVSAGSLRRGVTPATGQPYVYLDANEKLEYAVSSLVATTTPLFTFYDENYAGTSTPMTEPIRISDVSLIRVTLPIMIATSSAPAVFEVQGVIRSLRNSS